jgi:hypothetical protein
MIESRKLRVFPSTSSGRASVTHRRIPLCGTRAPIVRELCQRLLAAGWIDPWLKKNFTQ